MPIISEVWQDSSLFLQRIDPNIFNDFCVENDQNNAHTEGNLSNTSFVTNFIASLHDSTLDLEQEYLNIEIESHLETDVELVGLQVWRGALFLADYIIMHSSLFAGKNILELAAGTGLTSIVAVLSNQKYMSEGNGYLICTDVDKGHILSLIESNFQRNSIDCTQTLLSKHNSLKVKVAEIDFFKEETYCGATLGSSDETNSFSQNQNTKILAIDDLRNLDVIFAADIVYDEEITHAFFNCLRRLCKLALLEKQKEHFACKDLKCLQVFLSIEKRCRVSELKENIPHIGSPEISNQGKTPLIKNDTILPNIIAPNYDLFLELLNSFIQLYNSNNFTCNLEEIRTSDFIQSFFCYERVEELCLFKLTIFQNVD